MRRFAVSALAAALLVLVVPSVAHATTSAFAGTITTPGLGATYTAPANCSTAYGSMLVQAHIDPYPDASRASGLDVEVTNQNVLGQDGTLADDAQYRAGSGTATKGDADPSDYRGTIYGPFVCVPGTYYVQAHATAYGKACGADATTYATCLYATPVVGFRIVAPTAPPLTPAPATPVAPPPSSTGATTLSLADARADIRSAISTLTGRDPQTLHKTGCRRADSITVNCDADWHDRIYVWAGTLTFERVNDDEVDFRFRGLRAKRSCLKRHKLKFCTRTVRLA